MLFYRAVSHSARAPPYPPPREPHTTRQPQSRPRFDRFGLSVPHEPAILHKQIIREQLNVLRRVLQFVPLPLQPRTKVPEALGPAADTCQRCEVVFEILLRRHATITEPIGNRVHHEAQAYDA